MPNKTTIAIIGAMECEIKNLKKSLENLKNISFAGLNIYSGIIDGHNIIIAKSGVGKVNAAICTQYIIDKFQPDYIINTGIAGGIANNLKVGDIVIGKSLVQYDFDTSSLGYAKGYMCTGINPDKPTFFYSDERLIKEFETAILNNKIVKTNTHIGIIATGDSFISDNNKKQEIKKLFNAAAVEMEGAAIAQTAAINNIPCLIIRAISDLADESAAESLDNFEQKMAYFSSETIKILLKSL